MLVSSLVITQVCLSQLGIARLLGDSSLLNWTGKGIRTPLFHSDYAGMILLAEMCSCVRNKNFDLGWNGQSTPFCDQCPLEHNRRGPLCLLGFVARVSCDPRACLVGVRVGVPCFAVFLNEMMKSLFCLTVNYRY